jgi:YD repeat-containing protein
MLIEARSYDGGALAQSVSYEYDGCGNLEAVVTGNGARRTEYRRDRFGQVEKMIDPMGPEESYVYDFNGNLWKKTDRNGVLTTYEHDGLGRELSRSAATGPGVTEVETTSYTKTWGR